MGIMVRSLALFLLISICVKVQSWQNYTTENSGLPSNSVTSVSIHNGILWITTESGLAVFNGNQWINYIVEDGLISNSILVSMGSGIDQQSLWLGTDMGPFFG